MANGTLPAGTFPSEYGQTTDSTGTTIHPVDNDFTINSLTTSLTSGYNETLDSLSTGGLLLRSTLRPIDSDFSIYASDITLSYNTLDSLSTGGLLLRSTLRPIDSDFSIQSNMLYTYSLDSDKNYKTLTTIDKTALNAMLSTRSPITNFAENAGDMRSDQIIEIKITI